MSSYCSHAALHCAALFTCMGTKASPVARFENKWVNRSDFSVGDGCFIVFFISSPLTRKTGNPIGWLWNMTHPIWHEARRHFKAAQASRCTTLLYIYWLFLWPLCCFEQGILDCYLLRQTLNYRSSACRVYDLCIQTGHFEKTSHMHKQFCIHVYAFPSM